MCVPLRARVCVWGDARTTTVTRLEWALCVSVYASPGYVYCIHIQATTCEI